MSTLTQCTKHQGSAFNLTAGMRAGRKGARADDDDYDVDEEEDAWEPGRKRKAALKSKARYRELSGELKHAKTYCASSTKRTRQLAAFHA